MHIQRIEMQGFMCHEHMSLELPTSGVVVVTGHNGAGKSALVEAVAPLHVKTTPERAAELLRRHEPSFLLQEDRERSQSLRTHLIGFGTRLRPTLSHCSQFALWIVN